MRDFSFNGYDLQTNNIIVSSVKQFEDSMRQLNVQRFSIDYGGKLLSVHYPPKKIVLSGVIKGSGSTDLEERVDEFKKQLATPKEADLLIEYEDGNRRFIATVSNIKFDRQHYTIDVMGWTATFEISDPPFAQELTSTTLNFFGRNNSFATTTTGVHTGSVDHGGTVAPPEQIKITVNSATNLSKIVFINLNSEGHQTTTTIKPGTDFNANDLIIIDVDNGTVTLNGSNIDFDGGFPDFTLVDNSWTVQAVGVAYNIDIKFIYYKLWL